MAEKLGMSTGKGYHSGIYDEYATRAGKLITFVINSYNDLLSILEEKGYYGTYAIAINENEISLPNSAGTLPTWHSGIMVADTDVSLTLTGHDGSIVSAYYDGSSAKWSVQTLKEKPDKASLADSASKADVATVVSASAVYKYGQSVSIEQTGVYVVGIGKMTGKGDYYSLPTTAIILIDDLNTSKAVVVSATSNDSADTTSYSTNLVFDGSTKVLFAKDTDSTYLDLTVMRIAEIDNPI